MRILFVVESCLRINTSANLCHLAYIQGAVDAGYEVDVLSVTDQETAIDKSIELPKGVNWVYIDPPKLSNSFNSTTRRNTKYEETSVTIKDRVKSFIKETVRKIYGIYGRTPTLWVKEASKYRSDEKYEHIISLATPFISHKLGIHLIKSGHVKCEQFIEIWEDPWTLDLFNKQDKQKTVKEEKKLVSAADKIVYVSPLTLKYQQKLFPEYKDKMTWHPLPYYYKRTDNNPAGCDNLLFGYYGDYFSFSRNLKPFYEAAKESGIRANIFGNTDEDFASTDRINIKPRVDLKTLNEAEDKTSVYVFLCNLKGGQIPGKIYQNSATIKPILFILDGTDDERKILREYFEKFNRYEFCDNDVESIKAGIKRIISGESKAVCEPVEEFSPKKTIEEILK